VPSFGGATADTSGEELTGGQLHQHPGDCRSVREGDPDLSRHSPRPGQGDSLNNYAGIDRRNKAIALVEQWARE
jgi:hypothetical protein